MSRRQVKQKVLQLTTLLGVVSSVLSGLLPLSALAQTAPSYDTGILGSIPAAILTQSDLESTVCAISNISGASGAFGNVSPASTCKYLSSLPGFYANTPGYFIINTCNASPGQPNQVAFGNFLVQTGDRTGDNPGKYIASGTIPAGTSNLGTHDACAFPAGNFQNPPGFNPSPTSQPYLVLASGSLVGSTVPANSANNAYSNSPLSLPIYFLNPLNESRVLPYAFSPVGANGAVSGTDYTPFDGAVGGGGINYPPAGSYPLGGQGFTFSAYPFYNPVNHPEKRFQFTITPPSGVGIIGPNTIAGRILGLNRPALQLVDDDSNLNLPRGQSGNTFVVSRPAGSDTTQPMSIAYTVAGTATPGTDYGTLSGNAIIPAGQNSTSVPLSANPATTAQPAKTVTVTLAPSPNDDYTLTNPAPTLTYTIPAYSPATLDVQPTNPTATPGANNNGFTITRTGGDQTQPLTVNLTPGGTAAAGTDYSPSIPTSVAIPANQPSVFVPVSIPAQTGSTPTPAKTITVAVAPGQGYNTPTNPQPSTLTIPAYTPATLAVQPSSSNFTPGGTGDGFTITRSGGDQTQPLTVGLTPGGTATPGTDYSALPTTATIPANQPSVFVPVSVPAQTGSTATPAKTVTLTPAPGNGYALPNPAPTATGNIPAYTPASANVSLQPTNATFTPGGANNGFTVTRSGPTTAPLTVNLTPSGTATPGTDYTALPGSVTIPAGASSATLPVTVPTQTGTTAIPAKTLALTLASGTGYSVPNPAPTTSATIPAYNPAVSSLTTSTSAATLTPGASNDGFTITRSGGDQTQPLTVGFTPGGTATPGTDYTALPTTATIPANQPSVFVPVTVPAQTGTTAIPAKSIDLTLNPGTGYTLPTPAPMVNLTIPAYSPGLTAASGTVSFDPIANPTLTPGATNTDLVVTRTGSLSQPLTVPYTTSGTATPGTDYTALPGSVTIPAGASSAVIPVTAPNGATPGKTLQVALNPGTGYTNGANPTVTYTVATVPVIQTLTPVGTPTVSVKLDPNQPALIFTRTPEGLQNPLTVGLNTLGDAIPDLDYVGLPGSITFPGNQSEVVLPISLLPGATPGRTLTSLVSPGEGYNTDGSASASFSIPAKTAMDSKKASKKSGGAGILPVIGGVGAIGGAIALAGGGGAGASGLDAGIGAVTADSIAVIPGGSLCNALTEPNIAKLVAKIPELKTDKPYWDKMRFGTMKYQGQPLAQAVSIGETQGVFNLHCLSLEVLAQSSAVGKMTLAEWGKKTGYIGSDTTLKGLATNLYKKARTLGDIDGLPRFLAEKYGAPNVPDDFAEVVKKYGTEEMGGILVAKLPGIKQSYLGEFVPNWKTTSVSQIMGLQEVSFRTFPSLPLPMAASKPSSAK